MKKLKPIYLFSGGVVLYILSFFLPVLKFSLGVKLLGWEVTALHFSEFAFVHSVSEYVSYLFTALVNFWVIGLILGYFTGGTRVYLALLSILALLASFSWLVNFEHTSVLLVGYYVWLLSIVLIIAGRITKEIQPTIPIN